MELANCLLCGLLGNKILKLDTRNDIYIKNSRKVCKLLQLPFQVGVRLVLQGLQQCIVCSVCMDSISIVVTDIELLEDTTGNDRLEEDLEATGFEESGDAEVPKAPNNISEVLEYVIYDSFDGAANSRSERGGWTETGLVNHSHLLQDLQEDVKVEVSEEQDNSKVTEERHERDSEQEALNGDFNRTTAKGLSERAKETEKPNDFSETPVRRKRTLKCDFCGYKSNHNTTMSNHVRTHLGEKPFECDQCDYSAAQKGSLTRHLRTHTGEKPYKCDVCKYAAGTKSGLDVHRRNHTGEKPFKCNLCSYTTAQKSCLDDHLRVHTGEKPYKCDVCDYAASHRAHLNRHYRLHTGEKPYKCDYCNYRTGHRTTFKIHCRTHTSEKPYKCNMCDYTTANKSSLDGHLRMHTGVKPYKCNHCDYSAAYSSSLIVHRRIHTGEKPFKCRYCDYASTQRSPLIAHFGARHSKENAKDCARFVSHVEPTPSVALSENHESASYTNIFEDFSLTQETATLRHGKRQLDVLDGRPSPMKKCRL